MENLFKTYLEMAVANKYKEIDWTQGFTVQNIKKIIQPFITGALVKEEDEYGDIIIFFEKDKEFKQLKGIQVNTLVNDVKSAIKKALPKVKIEDIDEGNVSRKLRLSL